MNRRKFLTALLGGVTSATVVPMAATVLAVFPVKPNEWYMNGKYHREEDAPVVIHSSGNEWWKTIN